MNFIEEEQQKIEKNAEYERARKRAMYLLGSRPYSAAALKEKLLNNYTEETAARVLKDMERYGFINDEDYAKKLASSLIKGKKYGAYRARAEMKRKGVPEGIITETLGEYEPEDYADELKALIRKKYLDKIYDKDGRKKTTAALIRRGYKFSEIKTAVLAVLEEND